MLICSVSLDKRNTLYMAAHKEYSTAELSSILKKNYWVTSNCEFCGRQFMAPTPGAKYCSNTHRTQAALARKQGLTKADFAPVNPEMEAMKEKISDLQMSFDVERETCKNLETQLKEVNQKYEILKIVSKAAVEKKFYIASEDILNILPEAPVNKGLSVDEIFYLIPKTDGSAYGIKPFQK
jgi:hypothetical protein